jgi:hypothetical protein
MPIHAHNIKGPYRISSTPTRRNQEGIEAGIGAGEAPIEQFDRHQPTSFIGGAAARDCVLSTM